MEPSCSYKATYAKRLYIPGMQYSINKWLHSRSSNINVQVLTCFRFMIFLLIHFNVKGLPMAKK